MDSNNLERSNDNNKENEDLGMTLGWIALGSVIISLAIGAIIGVIGLLFSISSFKRNGKRKALISILLNSLPVLLMIIVIFYSIK